MLRQRVRRGRAVLVASLLALMVVGLVPTARAAETAIWRGRTSQTLPMKFLVQTESGGRIKAGAFELKLRCGKTGEVQRWFVGFFADPGFRIVDGEFEVDFKDPFAHFRFAGTFLSPTAATGTVDFLIAELTPDDQAQLCGPGAPTWNAEPVPADEDTPTTATHRIQFRMDARGRVTTTVTS
ncbi:MAG TPA: hypothetical protein VEO00_01490 [Actinomycetota bacterium]|nr:hypothetical protein [Actinomycetota bacterium]